MAVRAEAIKAVIASRPRIALWYGREQRVGPHTPQRQFNVLGSIAGHGPTDRLVWHLDAGDAMPLAIGPDGARLVNAGDFNAEVPVELLTRTSHEVRLELVRNDVVVACETATLMVEVPWARDRPVRLEAPVRRADVQIVDGLWTDTADGLRTLAPGYDRLIALGDRAWRNYEVEIEATLHRFTADTASCLRGGFGILTRWNGHVPDGNQPWREWRPNGTIGWYRAHWDDGPARYRTFNISDAVTVDRAIVQSAAFELPLETRCTWHMKISEQPGRSIYHYQVASRANDVHCNLEAAGLEGESPFGSVLLIALFVDLTIHSASVVPSPGG